MPLSQRRSITGSAQQVHTTDAASAAAVSFLIGGAALNEACDILLAQSAAGPQSESQNPNNEDHCQKLAALYQKGKAAYNVICRADNSAPDIMSIMTPGNAAAKPLSAGHPSQSSLSSTANNTPLPRSRGSFTTPHGNKSKMTPGLTHRMREGSFGGNGGRIINRSLSDTSDVSNNISTPGGGNNNSNRGVTKSAATNASASKKQQQQKPRKADPPPEVMNFLKALNAGGSKAAPPASTPPPSTSSTIAAGATNNSNDSNATNSRKRPAAPSAPKQSNKKRAPPPPPRRRQSSRSSTTSNDEEHEEPNEETKPNAEQTTRRTRSKRRVTSNANYTRVFDIGETVFVQVDGKHYNAIVKDVDFKADEDEEGGDNDDATKIQRPVYEVEFSDGEVMEDVGGDDVHSADEEGW